MNLQFRIHYHTSWGQKIYLSGSIPELGGGDKSQARPMEHLEDGMWEVTLQVPEVLQEVSYHYFLGNEDGSVIEEEYPVSRTISVPASAYQSIEIRDEWRSSSEDQNALLSAAFTRALMRRQERQPQKLSRGSVQRFQLRAPVVPPHLEVCLAGSSPELGNWEVKKAIPMSDEHFPLWATSIPLGGTSQSVAYKYLLRDRKTKELAYWETGENRNLALLAARKIRKQAIHTDEVFRHPSGNWRGAGVAIPVFSLRSEAGAGIGEFADLPGLVDWADEVGLSLVQILPINDTIATHSWRDSYPYAAISVFALHPMFVRIEDIAPIKDKKLAKAFSQEKTALNTLEGIDYERVMTLKTRYLRVLYQQEKVRFSQDQRFLDFFAAHHSWLKPYAAFSALRDRFGTAEFLKWGDFAGYDESQIDALCDPAGESYDDIAIHYFIQYHLHKQLLAATEYAREKQVVLKGDLPIGIYRHSMDAWMYPELFHMDAQAGAPPDDFAVAGQNWRFPTYNWEQMAQNGFAWWRQRMTHLAQYFDAFRIDHILGFFRIWEIPAHAVQGIMGQFNPCIPIELHEFSERGIWWAEHRFTQPYIRQHFLGDFLGTHTEAASREFLEEYEPGSFRMKPGLKTQREIEAYLSQKIAETPETAPYYDSIRKGLYGLVAEVLFFPSKNGDGYCPRIAMQHTRSFQELDPDTQERLNHLSDEFFYHRHDEFWREQAIVKLPAICNATDMLICGEDLGMVPASVPGVMQELGLLSLEIQRMPKDSSREFGHPADAPYLSVVSTSSHDMPTIRGWWEQDVEQTNRFYHEILGHGGGAPFYCEPWIVEDILKQHLHSPAMWAIFPLQDLLGMDGLLRKEDPHSEQINVPANPEHYWRYRMHLSMKELMADQEYTRHLSQLIEQSGRG